MVVSKSLQDHFHQVRNRETESTTFMSSSFTRHLRSMSILIPKRNKLTFYSSTVTDPTAIGLPPLVNETLLCAGGGFCTREQFFKGFTSRHPIYAPATGAIYSNVAFQILTYALENITGVDFPTMVEESLYKPLNLTSSSWRYPPTSNDEAVISDPFVWSLDLGDETA